ncbi:MAG: D-aminoacyl-tRNA deacylase, partial [SAR324 cluster bacterium]|nr:D-aminoacyl-tRNA deacylase [SAR324 cluster bacterium]
VGGIWNLLGGGFSFANNSGNTFENLTITGGDLVLVSQFTLYADCRKGRRPSFVHAMPPGQAEPMYEAFVAMCRRHVPRAASGRFGAAMAVHLVNDGPVTILLDSGELQMAAGA